MGKLRDNNTIVWILQISARAPLGRLNAFDAKHEAVAADDLDATSGRQRGVRARQPDFAFDPYAPFAVLPGHGLAFGADQRLAAGHNRPPVRTQQGSERE